MVKLLDIDILLTSDHIMISNYHGKEFLGFVATGPVFVKIGTFGKLGEKLHMYIVSSMKVDEYGRPWQAPYGMRKIEAALLNAGYKVAIIHPDYVREYLVRGNVKILMLSHHDYFGLNAPSSTWSVIVGREPLNAYVFRKFMNSIRPYVMKAKERRGLKVVVGGPSAWQWLHFPELIEYYGVDVVHMGEGEKDVVKLVDLNLSGKPVPRFMFSSARHAPDVSEIPVIKHSSVNGLVEIGRGCVRNCAFCPVSSHLRPVRWYPLELIREEMLVNVREGTTSGIIHAEDVPLYGSTSVIPNPEKLIKLHVLAKRFYATVAWSHTTLASVLTAEERCNRLATKIAEIIEDEEQDWWGAQVGLETGSRRLAKIIMPAKAAPYRIENWWDVVERAMSIMHEIKLIPALTLIIGLPGETESDIVDTIELIERIRPYRGLLVPMFYVPMSHIRADKDGWVVKYNLRPEHIELMRLIFEYSVYWARDIVNRFYLRGPMYLPVRWAVNYFINYIEGKVREITSRLEEIVEELTTRRFERKVKASELAYVLAGAKCGS